MADAFGVKKGNGPLKFDDELLKYNKIGVLVSGGADSAILLYKIAKAFPDKSIIPVTYVEKYLEEGMLATCIPVVAYCKTFFNNISEHIIEYIDVDVSEKSNTIHQMNINLWNKGSIEMICNAVTANPPYNVMEKRGMLEKRVISRDNDQSNWYPLPDGSKRIYKPFSNIDKKQIRKFYSEEGVEDLWDMTGSCVRSYPPCGECWWCKERAWANE